MNCCYTVTVDLPQPKPKFQKPYSYSEPELLKVQDVASRGYLNRFISRGVCWGRIEIPGNDLVLANEKCSVFILTLYTTPLRTARCMAFLSHHNIKATLCIMAPPDDLVFEEYKDSGGTLSKGELGCTVSHAWILNHSSTQCNGRIVVLEDDADFPRSFKHFSEAVTTSHLFENDEVCMLGASDWHLDKRKLSNGYYIADITEGRVCGSFAYTLKENILAKHLSQILLLHPLKPADHAFHNTWPRIRTLYPPMFVADRSTTSIEGHDKLVKDYLGRCLKGVDLDRYMRLSINELSEIDCDCFLLWPKPKSCSKCNRRHFSIISALAASGLTKQSVIELCSVACGKTGRFFLIPNPPRGLRPKPPKDIAIVMATFNPVGYTRTIQNLCTAVRQFGHLPVFIVEMCYANAKPRLTIDMMGGRSSGATLIPVRSNSVMFHKENLWQIAANKISSRYTKLVFMDGDIIVDDPFVWISRVSAMLDTHNVLQPFSHIKFSEPKHFVRTVYSVQPLLVASSFVRQVPFDYFMAYPSPGYGIAVQRKWLNQIGGLITHAVVGAGDLMMLGSLVAPEHVKNSLAYQKSPFAHNDVERFMTNVKKSKVGFVPHEGLHLFHGSKENRQYGSRHEIMQDLQEHDLYTNSHGVLEFRDSRWSDAMLRYFKGRREDD